MLKKEIITHYLITLVWLAGLMVFKLILKSASFLTLGGLVSWFLFYLGALLGTMALDLDQLVYALLIYPEEKVLALWRERKIKELFDYLAETSSGRVRLPFHNAIFQVFWMIFCFWILTSTNNLLVKGLVMGMGLHLLKDEGELLLEKQEEWLRTWLFWPVKREISLEEQKIFIALMGLVFLGLSLFLI